MNAQHGADLAQGPTLGVQVGCTRNVHCATVMSSAATSDNFGMLFPRVGEAHRWSSARHSGRIAIVAVAQRRCQRLFRRVNCCG
jgi:hypothetical protein